MQRSEQLVDHESSLISVGLLGHHQLVDGWVFHFHVGLFLIGLLLEVRTGRVSPGAFGGPLFVVCLVVIFALGLLGLLNLFLGLFLFFLLLLFKIFQEIR